MAEGSDRLVLVEEPCNEGCRLRLKPEQVGPANSTLEATSQVSRIGGPAIAGALLTIVSAPGLIIVASLSYIVSFASLSRIRDTEVAADPEQRRPLHKEIAEGVRFVAGQPLIRSVAGTTATSNFFSTLGMTLFPIFALRTLDIGSLGLGITLWLVWLVAGICWAVLSWFLRDPVVAVLIALAIGYFLGKSKRVA